MHRSIRGVVKIFMPISSKSPLPSPLGGEGQGEAEMISSSPLLQSSPVKREEKFLENWTHAALLYFIS